MDVEVLEDEIILVVCRGCYKDCDECTKRADIKELFEEYNEELDES